MSQILIFVGNLGRDPEMRHTESGRQVTNMSVAENRSYKTDDGTVKKVTTWFRVAVWGAQAEACNTHLKKGRQVQVIGRLVPDKDGNPRIWEGNDGFAHASFEVTAQQVQFLGSGNGANNGSETELKVAPEEVIEEDVPVQSEMELADPPPF